MTNKLLILSLLGLTSVYCQTPCSHNVYSEPNLSEASSVVSKYEPLPAAQELLNREYLPPSDFALPQANQAQPVYVAPPQEKPAEPLPKLQPLPKPTTPQPVYQPLPSTVQPKIVPLPKLQPLPQYTYVKPVYQPLPKLQPLPQATNVKPVYQPLPKLQPLPQTTYVRPAPQPLPKLQPLPSTVQPQYVPQPKLQPFQSKPRPVFVQPLPPSTLRPLPALPKLSPQPTPTFNRLPPLKPVQSFSPKQIVPPKSFQPKDNEVQASNTVGVNAIPRPLPQATNVLPRIAKPDLETAAQTNRFTAVNPDKIRINHYICEQGDPQQKFLCDILKLWDLHHHDEITSNELGDNSNNNPTFAKLPSSPRPTFAPLPSSSRPVVTYAPSTPQPTFAPFRPVTYTPQPSSPRPVVTTTTTTTTTTTPEPEKDFEVLPGDSEKNENAVYLPPYSTTSEPVASTTEPTTVDIPKRVVAPSNNNVNVVKPDESETSVQYTTPSTTTPYPSTTTTTTTVAPKEGYDYPKPSIPFPVPEQEGYDYPKPSIPFSDGISFPSISGAPLSSFNAPAPIFGSSVTLDSRFSNGINQFPFGFSPLASFSDSVQYQPLVPSPAPIVTSTTVAPELFFKSNSEFVSSPQVSYSYQPLQQSITTISPFSAPAVTYSDQTFTTVSPYTLSTPAPPTVSYTSSQPAFSQSLSTLAPLLLSKESLALSSSTPQPPSSQITTTESPIDKSSQVSTEKPTVTSTSSSTPLSGSYNSQLFGQYFNSLPPTSYSFPSFDSSLSSVSPVSYNFDNSLTRFNSFNYQPLPGVSYSSISPLPVQSYSSFAPLSGESYSTASPLFGQSYSSVSPLSGLSYSSGESYSTTVSPLFGQSYSSISPLSGQSYTTSSPLSVQSTSTVSPTESTNEVSSEKSTVTTTPASPAAGSFASQPFGQYFNPPSFSYNFQPIDQSVTTASPLSYTFEQSSGLKTNYSSFNYQPLSGQYFASQQPPVSYSFQPLGSSFVSGQSYNFPSSFSSGVFQSDSPSVSYTPSTPAPFNFQSPSQFDGSLFGQNSLTNTPPSSQNSQSLSSSGGAQFGHSSFSGSKSALSFSSNIQSVENLQDLQATSKESNDGFDLRQGNNQFAASFSQSKVQEAPRKSGEEKEDISLGNIEILKVKRKSPKN
ncbi:hypothetical protein M8J75_007979 [Diaphorina citri]|nr:hypothetical protein M8J75_007979 [Diaphorina citri]